MRIAIGVFLVLVSVRQAQAAFHLMQIEQVIGGVNGDVTAQAIQLRMRSGGQSFMSLSRIQVWDATGSNPVLVVDMDESVSNGFAGDRVLIASSAFLAATNPQAVPDFTMTALIPASYLPAGSLTFEEDDGTIYWRLSWGGAGYTGSNLGHSDNDNDPPGVLANFGPPFAGAMPSTTLQALQFQGTATALSTSNSTDYAISTSPAVFRNNARNSFTVVAPASLPGDVDGDRDVDGIDLARCVACLAGPEAGQPGGCDNDEFAVCDLNGDSHMDMFDMVDFLPLVR